MEFLISVAVMPWRAASFTGFWFWTLVQLPTAHPERRV